MEYKAGNNINTYADSMLNKIKMCIQDALSKTTTIQSAIVKNTNEDGTADIYFPPNNGKVFTRISNQTPFELEAGDGVEVILKNGSYSNCWIIAKHRVSFKKD